MLENIKWNQMFAIVFASVATVCWMFRRTAFTTDIYRHSISFAIRDLYYYVSNWISCHSSACFLSLLPSHISFSATVRSVILEAGKIDSYCGMTRNWNVQVKLVHTEKLPNKAATVANVCWPTFDASASQIAWLWSVKLAVLLLHLCKVCMYSTWTLLSL